MSRHNPTASHPSTTHIYCCTSCLCRYCCLPEYLRSSINPTPHRSVDDICGLSVWCITNQLPGLRQSLAQLWVCPKVSKGHMGHWPAPFRWPVSCVSVCHYFLAGWPALWGCSGQLGDCMLPTRPLETMPAGACKRSQTQTCPPARPGDLLGHWMDTWGGHLQPWPRSVHMATTFPWCCRRCHTYWQSIKADLGLYSHHSLYHIHNYFMADDVSNRYENSLYLRAVSACSNVW